MKIGEYDLLSDGVFIIAELSANHNGNLDTAIKTIQAASRAGANAIKLQTYTADTMTIDSNKDDFIIKGTIWEGQNLYQLYKEAHTPWEWHRKLFKIAKQEGLICFSSPFDKTAVDFLETFDVPAYKIASFEITDIPLIKYIASKGKPIILSTGIATIDDIKLAIQTCHDQNNYEISLLKCVSSYPAPIQEYNLCMIQDLENRFGVLGGLSDHSLGITAPIVAVTQGAKIIEKHLILDKSLKGPDSSFSLDEKEFTQMVKSVREAESSLGEVNYELSENQNQGRNFSRSLYTITSIKKGDKITQSNVKSIRPGYGLHPKYYSHIIGKTIICDLEKGTPLKLDMIKI